MLAVRVTSERDAVRASPSTNDDQRRTLLDSPITAASATTTTPKKRCVPDFEVARSLGQSLIYPSQRRSLCHTYIVR